MTFLFAPAAWLGLLALPIVAFYLLKTRQRRRPVSTLLFWEQLKPRLENSPFWRKLRRWLSLAAQLLIFALLLAALARPAFDWEQHPPRRTVAVIDPSASMQARHPSPSRWEEASANLRRSIAQLRVEDEMAIVSAEDPPRIIHGWSSSQRELREAAAALEVRSTATHPGAALELAAQLAALREGAEVAVFSDAVWPPDAKETLPPGALLYGVDAGPPQNAGLTLFAIRRSPVAPGDWQLDAEVTATDRFSGTLELRRDGEPMDLAPVGIEPGRLWQKSWRGSTEAGAVFTAVLKADPGDRLAIDNEATARLEALRPVRILLVGPADPFLEAVLDAVPLVQWSRVDAFPPALPHGTDLVITRGENLPAEPPSVATLLLHPDRSGFWGERRGTLKEAPVTDLRKMSRLLRHTGFAQVAIDEAGEWQAAPGSETIAASLEHPLIFGQWDRAPRWLVLGFDPAKSDLPLRTAFPVFMGNLLQSLRPDPATGAGAARLPGRVESELQPVARGVEGGESGAIARWPVFPGWWWALLIAAALLMLEWWSYHRRITD
ncbi:MAG TPA: BatA and WFA domain-containing protein [Chthoniobacteraceae bacterium]|nr:BatA and WFA domain-containing protein [Chthoniobacteraceae bacterium]